MGRPLPYGADPRDIAPGVPEFDYISTGVAIDLAEDYLGRGLPFHAHEVFEARWRCCPQDERDLWRALAQMAAGFTHHGRGNARGTRALLARAQVTIAAYDGEPVIDNGGRRIDFTALVARLRRALADDDFDELIDEITGLPRDAS